MDSSTTVAGFSGLPLDAQYRTGERDPVEGFYIPCLTRAVSYDRAVGYFRSSIYAIVGDPTLDFARRGGAMRLVCSPSITEEDASSIAHGYVMRDAVIERSLARDIDELLETPSAAPQARLLATLIKCGTLDLRIAIRVQSCGIYHEKLGIFTDGAGERVSFLGSANETWSAWHADGNHESIEVFREWRGDGERERVVNHAAHFQRLWDGNVLGVATLPFPTAQRQRLLDIAAPGYDDVDWPAPPKKAQGRTLQAHQIEAIRAWEAAGKRGVFEHATGSGKTFTAIAIIRKHVESGQPALVLVPSQLLLEQWREEIEAEIPSATILLAGGGNSKWKDGGRLRAHLSADAGLPVIVLATMQTAATDAFLREARGGAHLLLVADEVHQIGSSFNSKAMGIPSGAALGLSATPQRYGDPAGTAAIFDRFGPVVPPVITLRDAIKAGRLVDYEYFPHAVHLDQDEAQEWKKLTREISLALARSSSEEKSAHRMSEKARMLLIQRCDGRGGLAHLSRRPRASPRRWADRTDRRRRRDEIRLAALESGICATVRCRAMKKVTATTPAAELISKRIADLDDWRGAALARIRKLIQEADPEVVEEWKWRGTPTWSHDGILCTGESYKKLVKLTFAKGASLKDPTHLFNSSLDGNVRRALDIPERHEVDSISLQGAHPRGNRGQRRDQGEVVEEAEVLGFLPRVRIERVGESPANHRHEPERPDSSDMAPPHPTRHPDALGCVVHAARHRGMALARPGLPHRSARGRGACQAGQGRPLTAQAASLAAWRRCRLPRAARAVDRLRLRSPG